MVRSLVGSCTVPVGLLRRACGRPAMARCVYCGRAFCSAHGERGPDYADACSRKSCRAKVRDLSEHMQWKTRVSESNRASVCAHEQCEERMRHRCSRCLLMFCDEHVREMRVETQPRTGTGPAAGATGGVAASAPRALVCEHCRERRKLWD